MMPCDDRSGFDEAPTTAMVEAEVRSCLMSVSGGLRCDTATIPAGATILNQATFAAGGRAEIDQPAIGVAPAIHAVAPVAHAVHAVLDGGGGIRRGGAPNPRRVSRRVENVEQAV